MIATTRYELALLLHSQRYLPALIAFLGTLAVLYTSPGAPVLPEFAISAGALVVVTTWLTIALADAEDPVQRLITVSRAGGPLVALGGLVLAVLTCAVALTAVSLLWAALVHGGIATAELGWGALAHLVAACTGAAIGLPCSRLVVPRVGYTVIAALLALAVVLLVRWVPLVNPMLRALAGDTAPGTLALVSAALSVGALAVSGIATVVAGRR
ncbi:hypothetical protein ABZ863_02760 [Saccharomonospora sp. NPDC046836]|uniref:hypothetical protein n=1 Tax=Saccharomonospora sp. NPDC046836 TaxID=3156921 RepID=UPI0033C8C347